LTAEKTRFDPDVVQVYQSAIELMKAQKYAEAIDLTGSLVYECPYENVFHQMRAECLNALSRHQEAVESARRSLALAPQNPDALFQVAIGYLMQGNPTAANLALDRALVLSPDRPALRWYRSFCNLIQYRFKEGFADYEYGYIDGPRKVRCPINRIWDGSPTEVLFVHAEQGLGDQIQFARFLPLAKERAGGMLVLESAPELLGFFEGCADMVFARRDGSVPVSYTKWISIVSLPHVLGVTDVSGAPYFKAPSIDVDLKGARVGFVWAGNPDHNHDKERSLTLEEAQSFEGLAPFGALQPWGDPPFDMPRISGPDIGHSAAVIEALDLVVTVDTSIAHIAGSIGKECWMITPRRGEWRWGLSGNRSPWYDSIEIFRCPNGDRNVAIQAVQQRLRERYGNPPKEDSVKELLPLEVAAKPPALSRTERRKAARERQVYA
jgi:hypothetical protein